MVTNDVSLAGGYGWFLQYFPMPSKNKDEELVGELRLGVAAGGDLRWAVADVTGPLEAIRRALDLSPIAAVALGRALAAAALVLRFSTKEPGRLVLEVLGDGVLGKIVAEADAGGTLRGRVDKPRVATPEDGSMAIAWAVGKGTLRVTRESERGRYTSQVELVSGEVGQDLVHFLDPSQQIRSAALLSVLPRPRGIGAAGGLLVEAFPGVAEQTLERLEANIAAIDGVGCCLAANGLTGLRDAVLASFDYEGLESHPQRFHCRCRRDTLQAQIHGMAAEDLDAMADEDGIIIAECAFCASRYRIDREELRVN